MNVGERQRSPSRMDITMEGKEKVWMQTCLHYSRSSCSVPRTQDGTRGHIALTFIRQLLENWIAKWMPNMASGQGFMECRDSCAGDITRSESRRRIGSPFFLSIFSSTFYFGITSYLPIHNFMRDPGYRLLYPDCGKTEMTKIHKQRCQTLQITWETQIKIMK